MLVHIANYNSENWIQAAIQSVLNQTYQNWGLLVIDDRSSDKSPQLVKEFALGDERIRLVQMGHNSGTAMVHNRALAIFLEEQEWDAFCILDCDDVALPDWLSCGVGALQSGAIGLRPILSRYDESLIQKKWDYVGCNQTLWARKVIRVLGFYRMKPHMYDHDFMERAKRYAVLNGEYLVQSNAPLQKMRMRGDNQSLQAKTGLELAAEKKSVDWARAANRAEDLFVERDV